MKVSEALEKRMSVRGFLDKPVPRDILESLLTTAQRSPSGGNLQPWRVIALTGASKQAVIDLAAAKLAKNPAGEPTDRPVYPENLWEPHRSRRFAVGEALYGALGIPREDKIARLTWFANNFQFFNAPVALMFVIDERMGHGQWAHTGMFMQSIALLAEELGLGTCMQECWAILRPSLKEHLGLGETEMLYCGMALGYPDMDNPANQMRSERAPLEEFAEFRD
ncbi:nitroreductase [Ponticaulis sp.]|uniref:nitroreductase n=1 Tax=Ponticaulis sp. TaxID=2020902 RepID=UPI000B71E7E3|nr:nitroreductase [Ponticaulis sp.]MAI92087.1 nitroreductase family protein [Ponticaulis sp.]OUX96262.1 MAG: nitroreductase family protein [Hyphomonadaceae bacterium TMED5]